MAGLNISIVNVVNLNVVQSKIFKSDKLLSKFEKIAD